MNQPRTQIYDVNTGNYAPDWTSAAGKLIITPVVYANQTAIALTDSAITITWKRREGSAAETALTAGETVSGNVLTISANKLAGVSSGLLTYIAYISYLDPDNGLTTNATADISFALVKTGENAKSAWISGAQVFKYDADGAVSPAQITLTANVQNVVLSKWQYRNASDAWQDYPTTGDNATITGTSLIVKPTHGIWVGDCATLRIVTNDANISDVISIYKVSDGANGGAGADGQPASIAFLSNESITFTANASGQANASTVICNVVAYSGTKKVTPSVSEISGMPTGMTVTKGSASANEIPLTIAVAANATLGGTAQQSGRLAVPITSPVSTTLYINWSKVNSGADGAAGANAIVFSLYAPQGTVFMNGSGTLLLQTSAYDGSSPIISGATYEWAKYSSGSWQTISGETASSLSVDGADVTGQASYRCQMTYNGKNYQDVISLIDKTDNYQADIDSTAGDVFKNGIGSTFLICRLWQNGKEVDALKSTTYSVSAPTAPSTGTFYYKAAANSHATTLMRYSGSAWTDVSSSAEYGHTKKYTWYRRDKNGEPLDNGAAFATGKVISISGDDVDVKTVFVCEVE